MKYLLLTISLFMFMLLSGCNQSSADTTLIIEIIEGFEDYRENVYVRSEYRDRGNKFVGSGEGLFYSGEEDEYYMFIVLVDDDIHANIQLEFDVSAGNQNEVGIEAIRIEYHDQDERIMVHYSTGTGWSFDNETFIIRTSKEALVDTFSALTVTDVKEILIDIGVRELE